MSARLQVLCAALILATVAGAHGDEIYETLRDEAWASEESGAADSWAGSGVLELSSVVSEVQRQNPEIGIAVNTWRAALAQYPQSKSLADPMMTYGVAPLSLGGSDVDAGHRVEVSQQFPWPGKRRLRGERALAAADVLRMDIETVLEELARETRAAFYDYWYAHRALEINAVNAALLDEYVDLAESNYAAGATTRQDALQAEVEREHLEHDAIVLRRMANVSRARLNTLMLRDPQAALPPPPSELPPPGALPQAAALHALAIERRPELRALSLAIDADALGERLARKEFYPDFTVFGGYNSLWQEDDLRPIVGASVNLPIRLGRRRAAVEQAHAERLRSESALVRERNRVAYEVQQAYELLAEAAHVVRLYDERLMSIAEANLEAAEANYYSVEGDFLSLITAQRHLMDTQLGAHEALASYHHGLAELERAIGGSIEVAIHTHERDNDDEK